MRPIRLELEGFTAYREYTVLDFDGAELFVLTGPTGSGKSSLIDAMTFALYGSVPRYANPNLVHPVISQGKVEARVRFDFAIGNDTYTAVRVVRKTPRGGATTKEARLESRGHLVAGTADDIARAMRRLLGLNFDQFTTCVVLPQGEFARFLHEKPAQRQDLLTKLLGVDIYETMGNLARTREAVAKQKAQLHREELEQIRDATDEAKRDAERTIERLENLRDRDRDCRARARSAVPPARRMRGRKPNGSRSKASFCRAFRRRPATRSSLKSSRCASERRRDPSGYPRSGRSVERGGERAAGASADVVLWKRSSPRTVRGKRNCRCSRK